MIGAPLEVNLAATTRNKIIADFKERFGGDEGAARALNAEALTDWIRPAYTVCVLLRA